MSLNIWNKWGKLKTVLLGTVHPIEFYNGIKSTKISDPLKRIAEESMEDLDNFEKILKDFGTKVIRTPTISQPSITDYFESRYEHMKVPRNALQPRDGQLVVGNKMIMWSLDNKGITKTIIKYCKDNENKLIFHPTFFKDTDYRIWEDNEYSDKWDIKFEPNVVTNIVNPESAEMMGYASPSITIVGKDIIIDAKEINENNRNWFKQKVSNFRINTVEIGGHNDSCFHTLKEGAIISLMDIQNYEKSFPGWDVCYLPDQSWEKVKPFLIMKQKVEGKWWLPGEEKNNAFINFVETWLGEWVGYVEETVFDVNVCVLDEHHVCVTNPNNKKVNDFLKKHKMEPVHVPWRHRFFWDGGLHCITLDLEREGDQVDYFPNREEL